MKFFFLFVGVFIISEVVFSQSVFKVISVNGEIVTTKSKVTLKSGLDIKSDESFKIMKPQSRAALINSEKGRIIITEQNAGSAFSKAAFAPAMSGISSRGISLMTDADLKNYFAEKLIIIEKMELKISNILFPMNDQSFFFIRYIYNGVEINKKLPYTNDTLIIDKNDLYTIDGKPIPNPEIKQMSLYYYVTEGVNSTATLISTFDPLFVDKTQIKGEIQLIINTMNGKPYEAIFGEVFDYISGFYGKIESTYLEDWLKAENLLKK
jgi:hypothetical protein